MLLRIVVLVTLIAPSLAFAQSCPAPLSNARQLVLVTPDTMTSTKATLRRFVRSSPNARWRADGGPVTSLIGRNGTAWAHAYRRYASPREPIKVEGDERVPAGFYRIGPAFGFGASRLPGYLRIGEGVTCVDDVSSPAYNTITTRARVGWQVHGENMWRVPAYRRGLLVDYPTDRRARAGSCVFIHVRLPSSTGTSGCVAVSEPEVERLQQFSQAGAVLAIVPRQALNRFAGCLPD
ncbi:MAG: hypothetical protein WC670_18455 [Pseudolabrys sp.]|jgi:L,D-peptidoglycan transpeptidase YkuD (ErfK/YbiS/YcfS/YnhG family)